MSDIKNTSQDWKIQPWKTAPTWDPVILSRYFQNTIKSMKTVLNNQYLLILSGKTEIEIWDLKTGLSVFSNDLSELINDIDYYEINCCSNNDDFILICGNKSGKIITVDKKCTIISIYQVKFIVNLMVKDTNSIIILSDYFLILNCYNLSDVILKSLPSTNINNLIINSNEIIYSTDTILWKYEIDNTTEPGPIKIKQNHQTKIWSILNINSTYLLTICSKEIKIWKRPNLHTTNYFELPKLNQDSNKLDKNLAQVHAFINSERYLFLMIHKNFYIYDCINGSVITKATDAHNNPILTMNYLEVFGMLVTISDDGILRFWSFNVNNQTDYQQFLYTNQKHKSSPKSLKSFSFNNLTSKVVNNNTGTDKSNMLLGCSTNNLTNKVNMISCVLQLRTLHQLSQPSHFIYVEHINGFFMIIDNNQSIVYYRDREFSTGIIMKSLLGDAK